MNRIYIFSLSLLLGLFLYALPASSVVQAADATGACCLASGSCASDVNKDDCNSESGTYQGDGTECKEDTCSEKPD